MTFLIAGLALWWTTHLLPIQGRALRARIAGSLGEIGTKGLIAVLTVVAVILMVKGYQAAPYTAIWTPPGWTVHLNNLLMVLAIALMIAGGLKSSLTRFVRHPQLAAVKTWAIAHLLVNGDLASVILFGGMLAWAVVALIGTNKRDGKGERKPHGSVLSNVLNAVVAVVLFGAIAWAHDWAGVWPFPQSS